MSFCGERVKVGFFKLLPTKSKSMVTCASCGERSQVAGATRIAGVVAGIVGGLLGVWLSFPRLEKWSLLIALVADVLLGYLAGRLTLRLDPPDFAD